MLLVIAIITNARRSRALKQFQTGGAADSQTPSNQSRSGNPLPTSPSYIVESEWIGVNRNAMRDTEIKEWIFFGMLLAVGGLLYAMFLVVEASAI